MNANLEWNSRDYRTALAAVERIDDRELLARIAVEAVYAMVRIAAINKLVAEEHQPLLARIAETEDESDDMRLEAIRKIVAEEHQPLLAEIAKTGKSELHRWQAIEMLTDPACLTDVFYNSKHTNEHEWVFTRLIKTDHQQQLAEVLVNIEDRDYKFPKAAYKVSDPACWVYIAVRAKHLKMRLAAMNKLIAEDHQPLLARIATEDESDDMRLEAIRKLISEDHQPLLARIATEDEYSRVRIVAMNKLIAEDHQPLLARIATTDSYGDNCAAAIEKLNAAEHQPLLIEFALNTNMIYRAIAAVKKVDDISRIPQSTLATIIAAVSWTDFDNKIGAIADKITDQAELFRVATTASLKPVRQAALCRLADVELLCKFIVSIAEGLKDKYEPNRLEAESLLKYIYWKRKESLVRQQIASYNGTLVEEAGEDEGEWDSQCGEDYYYITQKGSPARYFRVP